MSTDPSTKCSLSTASSAIFAPVTASAASSAVTTPPSLIVTAPEDTAKLSELKDAIPLFDVVASSPAIVISSSDTVVSIPSPPVNVKVLPVVNVSFEPLSAAIVNEPDGIAAKLKLPEPSVFKN